MNIIEDLYLYKDGKTVEIYFSDRSIIPTSDKMDISTIKAPQTVY